MNALLRLPGVRALVTFYRYIYINQPVLTTLTGLGLILMVGLTHMYAFPDIFGVAPYLGLSFAALFAGTLFAAGNIARGSFRWGWGFGAALCVVAIVAYVLSRLFGFPGYPEARGAWDTPAGSFAVAFELAFIAITFAIATGLAVAYPDRRDWHD
ncbi:hypothetical protein [Rubrobacter calidifluminis]|uniref:hypothetical protein n=1 Tax=Rubrobacter calidifluminis TaxID=1392640 RepID=UPI00235E2644|nr:hypothetical protein [Rubrobacter calidifluminis]